MKAKQTERTVEQEADELHIEEVMLIELVARIIVDHIMQSGDEGTEQQSDRIPQTE